MRTSRSSRQTVWPNRAYLSHGIEDLSSSTSLQSTSLVNGDSMELHGDSNESNHLSKNKNWK